MREMHNDDYRYSEEAQRRNLKIIWKCDKCGNEREDYPGWNEGGQCYCGGMFNAVGETYTD